MMRVQAQQHRTKFLHKTLHTVNQSPNILSAIRQTTGPLIKVISGKQKKSGATPMTEEEEEEELRTYEAGLEEKEGSDLGLVTNTSGTMRNGSAQGTPALIGRSISRSARPSPKSKHFVARHSSSVDQPPRTVAEVSESGATASKAAKPEGRRVSGEVLQRTDTPSEKRNVVFSTTKRSIDMRSKRGADLPKHRSEGSPAFKLSAPAVLDALKKYHQGLSSSSRPRGTLSSTRNEVISVPSPKQKLAAPLQSESATPSPSPLKAAKLQPKPQGGKVQDITEKSELTPSPQPQPPTPRSVAKQTLAGTSVNTQDKGFSYKNSLTQNSVLTTNTNFTPTRWLPKGVDRQTLQQHAFLEDLLALHLPQDEKGGRYKGVTPSQLIGPERTASLPRGSITGAPIISQTEKQRTRYKKVKQRRNVLRDEQFLHREGDFYKDIFLDEYYKRRHLARREEFFTMLQSRLLPEEQRPQSKKKVERTLPAVTIDEGNRFQLYSRQRAYHSRQQGSMLSPSKIADSFESVLLASSGNREELQPPPVFNRFRNVLSGGTVKKEDMSLKFNSKLLDMRARFKRGEVRIGTSPVAQNMYYDQMGLEFSRQLLSREALSNARRLKPKSAAFSFDASVASPLGTVDSDTREHFVPKKQEVKGAGLGIQIGYTGIEPRSKDFYLDMLSDSTTPLILPDIPEQQRSSKSRGVSAPFRSTGFRRIEISSPRSGDGQVRVT